VNTVTASFNNIMGQMTEMSQRRKTGVNVALLLQVTTGLSLTVFLIFAPRTKSDGGCADDLTPELRPDPSTPQIRRRHQEKPVVKLILQHFVG